jgi:hypothetical protein
MEGVQYQYRRSKRESMVVLSVKKPRVNTIANANPNSVGVLKGVLAAAHAGTDVRGAAGGVGGVGGTDNLAVPGEA